VDQKTPLKEPVDGDLKTDKFEMIIGIKQQKNRSILICTFALFLAVLAGIETAIKCIVPRECVPFMVNSGQIELLFIFNLG
jgi:type IV secretory pathway component VirB8